MPDDLYERDILIWSERQAELLRRMANGERLNTVDWPNVIGEIADVGASELNAVRGYLRQAMSHLLRLHLAPDDLARDHWHTGLEALLDNAADRFSPSVRQRIDLDAISAKARTRATRRAPAQPPPLTSPWTLDDLLAGDTAALLAALPDSPSRASPA